jgi:hypothetical protein
MSDFSSNCLGCFSCDICGFNACPTGDCPNGLNDTAWCDGEYYKWFEENSIEVCSGCQKEIEIILAKKKISKKKRLEFVEEIIQQGLEKYKSKLPKKILMNKKMKENR